MTSDDPREADGARAEVAHVGVERLAAGDHEDDAAEHEERRGSHAREEAHGVEGMDRPQDGGACAMCHAGRGRRWSENQTHHHRAEDAADAAGAALLDGEERDEDRRTSGHDGGLEAGVGDARGPRRR